MLNLGQSQADLGSIWHTYFSSLGLQYFLKRYLTVQVVSILVPVWCQSVLVGIGLDQVTREKIDQAAKMYAEHFGDGTSDNPVGG